MRCGRNTAVALVSATASQNCGKIVNQRKTTSQRRNMVGVTATSYCAHHVTPDYVLISGSSVAEPH